MTLYEKSVDVTVPVRVAYDQWTRFETFPVFMSGVTELAQTTPTTTHWTTSIAGVRREFDATITEQRPDERIAWRSDNGPAQAGVVTFHRLSDDTTRIHVQLELEPQGLVEHVGAMSGAIGHRLDDDLSRFKDFVESRGMRTGGWRGTVEPGPQDDQAIGHTPGRTTEDGGQPDEVANPDRTRIDDEDPLSQGQPGGDEDVHQTRQRHGPRDQPWPAVAKEVRQAVEDADGPLE